LASLFAQGITVIASAREKGRWIETIADTPVLMRRN
jgi:hypothetical protein